MLNCLCGESLPLVFSFLCPEDSRRGRRRCSTPLLPLISWMERDTAATSCPARVWSHWLPPRWGHVSACMCFDLANMAPSIGPPGIVLHAPADGEPPLATPEQKLIAMPALTTHKDLPKLRAGFGQRLPPKFTFCSHNAASNCLFFNYLHCVFMFLLSLSILIDSAKSQSEALHVSLC